MLNHTHVTGASSAAPSPEPLLVNATVAAEMLSVSARTLWALTKAGDIPHIRIHRRVLYSVASLREWILKRERLGTRPADGVEKTP
ncbi:MAG: helix-turn-helix domain-containing protein [Planctomycetes bacterium]|nr:helix-turn-helix domain-containing protein [Planctomycetota bacterium]